jgi:hypothetical protein
MMFLAERVLLWVQLQEITLHRATIARVRDLVAAAEGQFRQVLSFFALPTKKLPKAADFWLDVLRLLRAVKVAQQQALDDHHRQVARAARAAQKVSRLSDVIASNQAHCRKDGQLLYSLHLV